MRRRCGGVVVRRLCQVLLWLTSLPGMASTYTVMAPHLTMHVGDPVPPLIFSISSYSGSYASLFAGEPARTTPATSSSPAGNYPIVLSPGSLKTVNSEDSLQFVGGTLTIIPPDLMGAQITNTIAYPPGFFTGPTGHSVINVVNNATANLVGDCVTDNAPAFNLLLSQNKTRTSATTNGGSTPLYLYFPPGCYATSQPLTIYGNSWTLWGSGPQRSYIRLLPNSAVFNTGTPTQFFSPQSVLGNENFREYIYNLGFDIGVGNPDAIPFTTEQNNAGAVRNVQIWADDSNCPYAISFTSAYPGPMLFKNVAVYGCKTAYSSTQNEYNITFENFTTEAQTVTGLDNHYIETSIRHWLSDNTVQALHAYGAISANVAVLDSEILSGGSGTAGIAVDAGSAVYLTNLISTGYSPTEIDKGAGPQVVRSGNINLAWTGTARSIFNSDQPPGALQLPVSETPIPEDPPVNQWIKLSTNVRDWPAQVAGSTSPTLYTPPGIYSANGITQIDVPDTVNHLEFYQSKFPTSAPRVILAVAGVSQKALIIDGCPYGSCQIVHTGSRAIVLRDTTLSGYTARAGAGDVYIEDCDTGTGSTGLDFYASQHIWARQLNLEQLNTPKFTCSGCTIWILGYKTEQATPSIILTNQAQAEVFGFFFYQNAAPTPEETADIYLTDSSLVATGWAKVDLPGHGHPDWAVEIQGTAESSLAKANVNTSQQLTLFYSHGGEVTSASSTQTGKNNKK